MATFSVAFCEPSTVEDNAAAVATSNGIESEVITTSATSQQSTNSANNNRYVVRLAVSGGAVWVKISDNPTAAAGDDFLLPDGAVEYFAVNPMDKVAVIDA